MGSQDLGNVRDQISLVFQVLSKQLGRLQLDRLRFWVSAKNCRNFWDPEQSGRSVSNLNHIGLHSRFFTIKDSMHWVNFCPLSSSHSYFLVFILWVCSILIWTILSYPDGTISKLSFPSMGRLNWYGSVVKNVKLDGRVSLVKMFKLWYLSSFSLKSSIEAQTTRLCVGVGVTMTDQTSGMVRLLFLYKWVSFFKNKKSS